MTVHSESITLPSKGFSDVLDLSEKVRAAVRNSGIADGIATVFVTGSTAGVTTIEYEPGLKQDIQDVLEEIAPLKRDWKHHGTWGDDNGSSHIRASLLGPSVSVPIVQGELTLGTWQQIVVIDCDTRPRDREVRIQLIGDSGR